MTTTTAPPTYRFDPELDLVLEREIDVPVELVWEAWTKPEHVKEWFTPRPWTAPECEIDLRPGGLFRTVMRGPEGEEFENIGCYLEIVERRRLVFTSAMGPGYRPIDQDDLPFTAIVTMEPTAAGTRYTATAVHRDPEGRVKHEKMGFHEGWGAALDQLVALARTL
ncbi:MAG: SRPBCC family protein [Acidimicrobiia bacterium]